MVGAKVRDQLQQYTCFLFLGDRPLIGVVMLGLAGIRLVKEHNVEVWLQKANGLGERGHGRQRAIHQNDSAPR